MPETAEQNSLNIGDLTTESNKFQHETDNTGTLVNARSKYIAAKKDARSWWKGNRIGNALARLPLVRRFSGVTESVDQINKKLDDSRKDYEENRNRYIQLEAKKIIQQDTSIDETTTDDEFRQALAETVAGLAMAEMQNLTNQEMENTDGRLKALWRRITNHPAFRIAVGAGFVGAAVTGNIPLMGAFAAARFAISAKGAETLIHGIQDSGARLAGDRRDINVSTWGPDRMDELRRRIAAFSENRILTKNTDISPTEQALVDKYRELLRDQIKSRLTVGSVENWKKHQKGSTDKENDLKTQDQIIKDADNAIQSFKDVVSGFEKNISQLEDLKKEPAELIKKWEEEKADLLKKKDQRKTAEAEKDVADKLFKERSATDPDGLLKAGVLVSAEQKCKQIAGIDKILNDPKAGLTDAARNTFESRRLTLIKDLAQNHVIGANNAQKLGNAETLVNAYESLKSADEILAALPSDTEMDTEIAEIDGFAGIPSQKARIAIIDSQIAELRNQISDINNNIIPGEDARKLAATNAKDPLQKEVDKYKELTKYEAILVHNILLGGDKIDKVDALAGVTTGRAEINKTDKSRGALTLETSNLAKERRMVLERNMRGNRWVVALILAGVLNAGSLRDVGAGASEGINNLINWWNGTGVDTAQAASSATQSGVEAARQILGLQDIQLPAGSNPWNEAAKVLQQQLGRVPTNSEIYSLTKIITENSNISVPSWDVAGGVDHKNIPVGYTLKLGARAADLITKLKGVT